MNDDKRIVVRHAIGPPVIFEEDWILIAFLFFFHFCHRGADICKKCWLFMVIAMKIVDSALESKLMYTLVFLIICGMACYLKMF